MILRKPDFKLFLKKNAQNKDFMNVHNLKIKTKELEIEIDSN